MARRKTKRHEVYTIELKPRTRAAIDSRFHDFGSELEYRMNYIRDRGYSISMMQILEGRGMLILVDKEPPESPFEKAMKQAIPLSAIMPAPTPTEEEEDKPEMHPSLHTLLRGFSEYMMHSGIRKGSEKEEEGLKEYVRHKLSSTNCEEIQHMLDSLKAITDHHEKKCEDDDCDIIRFFKLAHKTLSTYLNQRLQ